MRRPNFILILILLPVATAQEKLPDGAARATVLKICGGCHEIGTAISSRRTKIGWQRSVDDMITRGAEGSDDDMEAVIDYLTTNFGKINVNTAAAKDLETMLDLSAKESQAIVAYRDQNGKIKDFEQLKKVPGVSAEKVTEKRSRIAFSL